MLSQRGFEAAFKYMDMFLEGLVCTVSLSAMTVLFGFMLALVLALMRMAKFKPLNWVAATYVEIFRATPLLVQLFIVYHVLLAGLDLPTWKIFGFIRFERFIPGVIALSLNSGAYLSEIIRSGIQAVDIGQTEAARSLGLTKGMTMRKVVLPQAVKNILPALGNEFVTIIKETSLASTFFVGDLMTAYLTVKGVTYLAFESLIIVGAIYFILTFTLSKLVGAYERRLKQSD